jgi:threonylcarbamoyladenosine tRNA methylthiotransferase MtaB
MGMKATGTYSFEVKKVKVQTDFNPELVNETQIVDLVRINHNGIVEVKIQELELAK